tara:strand:+ start:157 stop:477 length:321 start_codon:yes stop_codon:yes gene_type:complete
MPEHPLITALGWDSDGELSPEARATKATIERLQYRIPSDGLTTDEIKDLITSKHREMAHITDWLDSGMCRTVDELFSFKEAIQQIESEIVVLLATVPTDQPVLGRV